MLLPRRPHDNVSGTLHTQWTNPSDILTVLMIIGGSIVRQALGQLAGSPFVPVAFSFGWVAYSFEALLSAVSDNRLMPSPDCPAILINASSGFVRQNQSWVLNRVLRDFEEPTDAALCVTVFRARPGTAKAGRDWIWSTGVATMLLQLGISVIPLVLYDNWSVLLATAGGTLMALLAGALPQWRTEKWACRRNTKKNVCLTRGNGFQHVMLVLGDGVGLDLEDLAGGRQTPRALTRPLTAALAFAWLVFLVTVSGLKDHSWYLLAVGFVGMVQNVVAAGAPRTPDALGIPLQRVRTFTDRKVMKVLMATEEAYPGAGASLLPVFFLGMLRPDEMKWWDERRFQAAQQNGLKGQQPAENTEQQVDSEAPPKR